MTGERGGRWVRSASGGSEAGGPWATVSRALVVMAVLAVGAPGRVSAQDECEFLAPSGNFQAFNGITRVSTPHLLCRSGKRIRSDSLRFDEGNRYYEFFGSVVLEDPDRVLRSDRAQYFASDGRVQAQENVRLTRKSDNGLITGRNLNFQPAQGGDTEDRMVVTGDGAQRPHAVLYTRVDTVRPQAADSASTPQTPYEIDADRILLVGQDDFDAGGNVVITRDSLQAFGDRALFNRGEGTLFLRGRASLIQNAHTLKGDSVDVLMPEDEIEEVVARGSATLTDEDLDVRAPLIRILMAEGQMDRMVAVGRPAPVQADPLSGAEQPPVTDAALLLADHPARPVARAEGFVIISDSIDTRLPEGALESLTAVGDAHGESTARDSLNSEATPEVIRRDWIDGETIVASFAPVPAVDSVSGEPVEGGRAEYRLERLVSGGSARSLYRMSASDSAAAEFEGVQRPAVDYVVGDTIKLFLDQGEIQSMEVIGQVRGMHFEPVRRGGGGGAQPGRTGSGGTPRDEEDR